MLILVKLNNVSGSRPTWSWQNIIAKATAVYPCNCTAQISLCAQYLVQRSAARLTRRNFKLQQRRARSRLIMLYHIRNGLLACLSCLCFLFYLAVTTMFWSKIKIFFSFTFQYVVFYENQDVQWLRLNAILVPLTLVVILVTLFEHVLSCLL